MIDKAEYIDNYLSNFPSLTWTSYGGSPEDIPQWIEAEQASRLRMAEDAWRWLNSQHSWNAA